MSTESWRSGNALIDDLEDIAVDGFAKEEALERCGTKRWEQLSAFRLETLLERVEFGKRIEHRDVSSELVFKRRDSEAIDVENVHLLTTTEIEPYQFDGGIRGHGEAPISERSFEE